MPVDLKAFSHRPWPLPAGAHIMEMSWHDLLFAHWPVKVELLRRLVPPQLSIDCFEGEAWIGVVPFTMTGVRIRPMPALPGSGAFPEINVRTYVVQDGKPGVYFFSLDAASWLAVQGARTWYHLPYYHADIRSIIDTNGITYRSRRKVKSGETPAEFRGAYKPLGPPACGQCGPLAHWLTERYCLYTTWRGRVYRAEIHHEMWPLQEAEATIEINTMTAPLGLALPDRPPLLHFARRLDVAAWAPQRLA